jgi:mRNA-degrading endonuclease RelE of RelBE toxin-antitoxin system
VLYRVDDEQHHVEVVVIDHRRNAYRRRT